jgi:hypothetical protein
MEDLDAHRRYMLGGDGHRIYSINAPFLHLKGGSRTINQSPEATARFERLRGIGAAHYRRKWGGEPNQERFTVPFGAGGEAGVEGMNFSAADVAWGANSEWQALPVTTPELQQWYRDHPPGELADEDDEDDDNGAD